MEPKERRLYQNIALKLKSWITLENTETGQMEGVLAHRQTEKVIWEWGKQRKDLIKADKSNKTLFSDSAEGIQDATST
jgi:hypothetical protein